MGEINAKSNPSSSAFAFASEIDTIPSCELSLPINLTSLATMLSFKTNSLIVVYLQKILKKVGLFTHFSHKKQTS